MQHDCLRRGECSSSTALLPNWQVEHHDDGRAREDQAQEVSPAKVKKDQGTQTENLAEGQQKISSSKRRRLRAKKFWYYALIRFGLSDDDPANYPE